MLSPILPISISGDRNPAPVQVGGQFAGMVRPKGNKPPFPTSPDHEQATTSMKLPIPKMTQVDSTKKPHDRIQQVRITANYTVTITLTVTQLNSCCITSCQHA